MDKNIQYSGQRNEMLFELGLQFFDIGYKSIEINKTSDFKPFAGLVNLSFSCELFLKYLIEEKGEQERGHNLGKLFKNIDYTTRVILYRLISLRHRHSNGNKDMSNEEIEEKIRIHSHVFEDFRYLHENPKKVFKENKFDFNFIINLSVVLKTYCEKTKPNNHS